MSKSIRIFKSFEEQELFFLQHFFELTPTQRLQALAKVQRQNKREKISECVKKITLRKHFVYGN